MMDACMGVIPPKVEEQELSTSISVKTSLEKFYSPQIQKPKDPYIFQNSLIKLLHLLLPYHDAKPFTYDTSVYSL